LPRFQASFPGAADGLRVDDVYARVNEVKRSLIRIGADEVTYNLHIMLRYEIEKDLLNDRYRVSDLPGVWNDRMRDYLGLTPSSALEGVLQDAHWSDSFFGYFPTYALGNLYAAQLDRAVRRDIPNLNAQIARGEFRPLREWQRQKIHSQGMRYPPTELIERATGEPPSGDAFVRYVETKFLPSRGRGASSPQ
jgi:carboxypeptidase Taq